MFKNFYLLKLTTAILLFTLALSSCSSSIGQGEDNPGKFEFGNHSYLIVKSAKTYSEAKTAAESKSGYLVHINSKEENDKVYNELINYIKESEFAASSAADGGGASYVWIGANDIKNEGNWLWIDDQTLFWQGDKNGQAVNNLFNNWGKTSQQNEPDDWQNKQDAAAIALTKWPKGSGKLGSASQWNDIDINNKLFYVIEFDQTKK